MTVTTSWEPALTEREAATLDIPRSEYKQAELFAHMTVEEHRSLNTVRAKWEPTRIVTDKLTAPFVVDGEQELTGRLEREADPFLDKAQGLTENVKASLDEVAEHAAPLTTPESGTNYSVTEAVTKVEEHDHKIEQDGADGRHHHHRAPELLKRLTTWAPWLEAIGFLTFITYYLNVPIFEPWQDWLGWSFAVVVVVVIILGQTWLVRHAGKSHNQAREDRVEQHRQEASRGFRKRNMYLWLTALTALVITAGMIWRGTAALGSASFGTAALMIFAAAVTGVLLPTLAYLGIALDGSRVSRERDGLAAQLDVDLDDYLDAIGESRRDLARVAETRDTLKDKTFPDICRATQEVVDGMYEFYGTVRLLIGSLSDDPPVRATNTFSIDPAGNISGYIGTSVPGAGTVSLDALLDRQHRLVDIEARRVELLNQIDALASHPWGKSRT